MVERLSVLVEWIMFRGTAIAELEDLRDVLAQHALPLECQGCDWTPQQR